MKIALFQMKMSKNIEENITKSLEALKEAAKMKADLILYPELQMCKFFPQYSKREVLCNSVSIDNPIIHMFRKACKEEKIMAVPNVYLREGDKSIMMLVY